MNYPAQFWETYGYIIILNSCGNITLSQCMWAFDNTEFEICPTLVKYTVCLLSFMKMLQRLPFLLLSCTWFLSCIIQLISFLYHICSFFLVSYMCFLSYIINEVSFLYHTFGFFLVSNMCFLSYIVLYYTVLFSLYHTCAFLLVSYMYFHCFTIHPLFFFYYTCALFFVSCI